jgi:hypothetical protein
MQIVDKLAEMGLGDMGSGTRSKSYWPALSVRAIPEIVARFFASVVALASIAAVALVGVFSFGAYLLTELLAKGMNFFLALTTVASSGSGQSCCGIRATRLRCG